MKFHGLQLQVLAVNTASGWKIEHIPSGGAGGDWCDPITWLRLPRVAPLLNSNGLNEWVALQQASSVCGILLPEIMHRCHCACEQGGTRVSWDLYREFVQEFLGTGYSIQSSSMFHRPEMPLAKFHCYIIKWSDNLAQCVCQRVYVQCFYDTDG